MRSIIKIFVIVLMVSGIVKVQAQEEIEKQAVSPEAAAEIKEISIESLPPVVTKTVPQSGDLAVDPALKEISVSFSKDMMQQDMWAWVMVSKDSFPEITGNIKFLDDGRTCVAPVELKPNKTYAIWFNSENHTAFRCINGCSAVPYLLVFQTKSE
ncbi:MAG: Ig-like domain-containing protein [Candidatus Omnitrophota bacterium]